MQPTTLAAYLKLGAAAAIVGGLAAGAISLAMPRRYVATAVMRFTPWAVPGEHAWGTVTVTDPDGRRHSLDVQATSIFDADHCANIQIFICHLLNYFHILRR